MGRRQVFNKETNSIELEIDVIMTMNNEYCDTFLNLRTTKELKSLLQTQVEAENYEMAEKIKLILQTRNEKI